MDTETQLFLQLTEAFAEEKACEVPLHDDEPLGHSGPATWYMATVCTHCGAQSGVFASCEMFMLIVTRRLVSMGCPSCMTNPAVFIVPVLEKIKDA